MSENEPESQRAFSAFETIKSMLVFAGGLLGTLYAIGFLIVSTNLIYHGLVDLSLAKPRYLSVGVCFTIVAGFSVAPSAWLVHVAITAITHSPEKWRGRSLAASVRSEPILIQAAFWALLLFLTATVVMPFNVILLASHTGTGLAVFKSTRDVTPFWRGLWEILPGWFLPLIFFGGFLGFAPSMVAVRTRFSKSFSKPSTLFVPSNTTEPKSSRWIKEGSMAIVLPAVVGMVVGLLFIATHTYVTEIYPKIEASFGGGNFGCVRIVTDEKNAITLRAIIPMESTLISSPVRLLGEGADNYAVLVVANGEQVAAMINKTLVRGILSGKELTCKPGV